MTKTVSATECPTTAAICPIDSGHNLRETPTRMPRARGLPVSMPPDDGRISPTEGAVSLATVAKEPLFNRLLQIGCYLAIMLASDKILKPQLR